MTEQQFFAGMQDIEARGGLLAWAPDCIEAGGLVNLTALANGLAERVRALGGVQHMLTDEEVASIANALVDATITASCFISAVTRRMREVASNDSD